MARSSADRKAQPGRAAQWQARAERAAERYQKLALTRPLLGLPLVFLARYTARQGMLLASAAAFRLFLWMMPLALLVAGIFAGLTSHDGGDARSAAKAAGITGVASREIVTAIRSGHQSWLKAVVIGSCLFLWATRTLVRNLTEVNAHAWQVPLPASRRKDVLITTVAFAVGVVAMLIAAAGIARARGVAPGVETVGIIAQGGVVAAAWLLISLRLPDDRTSWIDVVPGCLFLGFGLAILHLVSRVYIPRQLGHSSELYGSLGVAAVILGWLLIIGQVIVSSALVNSVWTDYRRQRHETSVGGSHSPG